MKELSDEQIEKIIDPFKKGASLPEDYRESLIKHFKQIKNALLFNTKKEYARAHFNRLNELQQQHRYYFKFLSPMSYDLFFKALREKTYRDFKTELEARLEGR